MVDHHQYPQLRKKKYDKINGVQIDQFQKILPVNFLFIVVGKPGSGKSCLISELLLNNQLYYKKFDAVLFMTPSEISEIQFIEGTYCQSLDFEWLDQKFEELSTKFQNNKNHCNILICIDDLVAELKKAEHSQALQRLIFNRRHLLKNITISIIITTQKYTACPAKIRSSATGVFLFDLNKSDFTTVKNELFFMSNQELENLHKRAFLKQHGFIYILLQPYQIHINFKPEIAQYTNKLQIQQLEK